MKIITRQMLSESAKDRWYNQYKGEIEYGHAKPSFSRVDRREIYEKLCAITTATPDLIDAAIGNKSWTNVDCDECGSDVESIIELGQEEDYCSRTAHVCFDCLAIAMNKMEAIK